MNKINDAIKDLIADLSPKQKDIIMSRFGLDGEELTLAAIGDKYGLTRERIRQIESSALKSIKGKFKNSPAYQLFKSAFDYLEKSGGVKKEDALVEELKTILKDNNLTKEALKFIFEIAGKPDVVRNKKNFFDFWYTSAASFKKLLDVVAKAEKILQSKKSEFLSKNAKISDFLSLMRKETKMSGENILNYISVSKKFMVNSFGDFGLSYWEEINPKTMRSMAYLVLKKHGSTLHFRDITKKINEAGFHRRKALEATVHNELIKDPRFVLVGRGIYGLAEQGYRPGTAKDIINNILKEKGPLKAEQVVNLVKLERFLKDNTILLNLQNRKNFKRLPDGRYHVA